MAGESDLYWSQTVVDASPDRTTTVVVGQIDGVATNPYGARVSLLGSVTVTPGADSTSCVFRWRRNSADGESIGNDVQSLVVGTPEQSISCIATDNGAPVGVHSYVLVCDQTDASADAAIAAFAGLAIVGS